MIELPQECTIVKAGTDRDKIGNFISEDIEAIELQIESVKGMDTAYLQLLLSLKITAEQKGIPFLITGCSAEIGRVCELYGTEIRCKETNHVKNNHDR